MNEKLRKSRKEKGFTQEEMAEKLGYKSKSGYAMIETGKNQAPLDIAIMISEILEKPVEYLFGASKVHESRTNSA